MRSLQILLKPGWNLSDKSVILRWDDSCRQDLQGWTDLERLKLGRSLELPSPDLMLWPDASDERWGAYLENDSVSGLWSRTEKDLSINLRAQSCKVRPEPLSKPTEESPSCSLYRQLNNCGISEEGRRNCLSPPQQRSSTNTKVGGEPENLHHPLIHSRKELRPSRRSPSKESDPLAQVNSSPRGSLGYTPSHKQSQSLSQPRSQSGSSTLASEGVAPRSPGTSGGTSPPTASTERPSQTAGPPPLPPKFPSAKPLCLETVQLYARHEGFSNSMAKQLSLTRRKPTRVIYQNRVHGIRTQNGAERKVTQSLAHLSLNIRVLIFA